MHLHIIGEGKKLFQSVFWKFHRIMFWNHNPCKTTHSFCHQMWDDVRLYHVSVSFWTFWCGPLSLSYVSFFCSEDPDWAFGCYKKLGEEHRRWEGRALGGRDRRFQKYVEDNKRKHSWHVTELYGKWGNVYWKRLLEPLPWFLKYGNRRIISKLLFFGPDTSVGWAITFYRHNCRC